MKRFFGKTEGENIVFDEGEALHIAQVLRMREGEEIVGNIDDEFDYYCTLSEVGKKRVVAKIVRKGRCEALPKKSVTLFIAMPKREYFESIVTKSIELGVSEICPFISQFSVNHSFKRERVNQIVMTACKQCERSQLPIVHDVEKFEGMKASLKSFDMVIFANEHAVLLDGVTPFLGDLTKYKNIAVVVGCEGGFSEKEAEEIIKAGGKSISLGKRILRCDTAALATLALVNLLSGN